MPVAQLIGAQRLQLGLILTKNRLSQCLDRLGHRRLLGGFGNRRGAPQQAPTTECERARNSQVTTRDTHILSLPHMLSKALPSAILRRMSSPSASHADRTMVYGLHAI